MTHISRGSADTAYVPVHLIGAGDWAASEDTRPKAWNSAAGLARFTGKAGQIAFVQSAEGALEEVLYGMGPGTGPLAMTLRGLPERLPPGDYRIATAPAGLDEAMLFLAWQMGAYRFTRYKKEGAAILDTARLAANNDVQAARIIARACAMARDMVNTPANDMGPDEVESMAREIAASHGARIAAIHGEDLLRENYPLVHAVGRAADDRRSPRLVELSWGLENQPVVVIVGKGVVFDSGGLDIKPASGMRLMKKDMGGAAHALALADMIMSVSLPVRLHVLLPVVENAISGNAMRPGDVLPSRKGLSVEVGNTDAEGRLILADALTRAEELSPSLTIDLATLTGAARVALGPDVVPFYTDDDNLAADLERAAAKVEDPVWRMPIWEGYASGIESDIADLKNDPDAWVQAGSVGAALFLKRFAPKGPWLHCDIFAWNPRSRPGWPMGAEAQAIRGIFEMLRARYR